MVTLSVPLVALKKELYAPTAPGAIDVHEMVLSCNPATSINPEQPETRSFKSVEAPNERLVEMV
jgi:hypothetical protein